MQDPAQSDYCPRCKRASALRPVHRFEIDRAAPETSGSPPGAGVPTTVPPIPAEDERAEGGGRGIEMYLAVFECLGCRRHIVFHEYRVELPVFHGPERIEKHWWVQSYPRPEARTLAGEGIPEPVRDLFEEGGRAEAAKAPRAAAAMYRAAVEAICDALDVPRSERTANDRDRRLQLQERLGRLAAKGVAEDIVGDLHEARLVGNDSVHDGLAYAADELADVAELIAEAAHVLFVQPAERAALEPHGTLGVLRTRPRHRRRRVVRASRTPLSPWHQASGGYLRHRPCVSASVGVGAPPHRLARSCTRSRSAGPSTAATDRRRAGVVPAAADRATLHLTCVVARGVVEVGAGLEAGKTWLQLEPKPVALETVVGRQQSCQLDWSRAEPPCAIGMMWSTVGEPGCGKTSDLSIGSPPIAQTGAALRMKRAFSVRYRCPFAAARLAGWPGMSPGYEWGWSVSR